VSSSHHGVKNLQVGQDEKMGMQLSGLVGEESLAAKITGSFQCKLAEKGGMRDGQEDRQDERSRGPSNKRE